jgi:uncharacterized membrane protein
MNRVKLWSSVLFIGLALPSPALAYIGPGAGLSAIGTVVAVVVAIFLLIVGFVWYPIKRVVRGRNASKINTENQPADPNC